jgi:hypothetical protein
LLFPTLCRPTAPVTVRDVPTDDTTDPAARTLAMPRRAQTRAHTRAKAIDDQRRFNETLIQAEADQRAHERQQPESPGNDYDDGYFPTRPPPLSQRRHQTAQQAPRKSSQALLSLL